MYKTIKAKIHNKQLILEDDMEIPENSEVLIVFMNDADEVEENLNDYEFVFDEPVKADYLLKISNRDVLK